MGRGYVHYLHSAYLAGRLRVKDVWRVFAGRIKADIEASRAGTTSSALGLTPTNAFLNPVSDNVGLVQLGRLEASLHQTLLRGIPIGIKDNFCTDFEQFRVPTTCASQALKNFFPTYNAAVVESLLEAGGLIVGKTNMDEFAMGCGATDGMITGPVINPWSFRMKYSSSDLGEKTPVVAGGSSGGSAAAVAAGLCLIALASDTGGSSRLPASYCGVLGLKPTYGLVSRHGLIPLVNAIDVPAIIASRTADIAAVLATWLAPSSSRARALDATCCPLSTSQISQMHTELMRIATTSGREICKAPRGRLRIGIPVEYHVPGLDTEVSSAWDSIASRLSDVMHYDIQLVRLPHTPIATTVYSVLCASEVASNMARYDGLEYGLRADRNLSSDTEMLNSTEALFATTRSEGFGEVVRGRIFAGNFFLLRSQTNRHLKAARRLWRLIKQDFDEVFTKVDFLLTPVALGPPPRLEDFVKLDNRARTTLDDVCTVAVNLAGLPALAFPVCLSTSTGLPIGLQLIGPPLSEPNLLSLALKIEDQVDFPYLVNFQSIIDSI